VKPDDVDYLLLAIKKLFTEGLEKKSPLFDPLKRTQKMFCLDEP
jgi:hypothetical protein